MISVMKCFQDPKMGSELLNCLNFWWLVSKQVGCYKKKVANPVLSHSKNLLPTVVRITWSSVFVHVTISLLLHA